MIEGLHHVQLAMPEGGEQKAVAFYQGLLGITQVPKPEHLAQRGGCWFENEHVRIHLGVDPRFAPATKAHPALLTSSLDELIGRLGDAVIGPDQPLPGFHRVYVSDPFGNRIELLERQGAGH